MAKKEPIQQQRMQQTAFETLNRSLKKIGLHTVFAKLGKPWKRALYRCPDRQKPFTVEKRPREKTSFTWVYYSSTFTIWTNRNINFTEPKPLLDANSRQVIAWCGGVAVWRDWSSTGRNGAWESADPSLVYSASTLSGAFHSFPVAAATGHLLLEKLPVGTYI
ncbi:hypothetical protein J6590_002527 [Homalodisca vitripennis]|nr:hypothetical protein J6590_002527 [Homalodisca vitripennis]